MELLFVSVRINDTVTFVEDGLDEDIEFGDEISNDDEDDVDNVSLHIHILTTSVRASTIVDGHG